MSGYVKALKLLDDEIRQLMDQYRAKYSDQPGTSRDAKRLADDIQRKEEERRLLAAELERVSPGSLEWGATRQADQVQEMMDRYRRPEQMELPLQGGQIEDVPFTQPPAGFTVDDPYREMQRQRAIQREHARALRGEFDDAYADRDWD